VFVEQPQPAAPLPAPPAQASTPTISWYYCTSPAGYYPYVQSCTKPWVRVVPDSVRPEPPAPLPQIPLPPQG
jgi:hypothetical protein